MLGEISIMFLVHPTLREQEIRKTCDAIHQVMRQAESVIEDVGSKTQAA